VKRVNTQKGFLSVVAVLLVVVVSLIAAAAAYQFVSDARTSANELNSAQAFYMAQSGVEAAKHTIVTNGNSCISINGLSSFTGATFTGAPGVYTVTGTLTSASGILNGALTAAASTIPLVTTLGFANSGVITIGSEYINYTGISGNSLTGATRGVRSTTAAAYSSGTAVSQNQCVLNSTGYIPSVISPVGKRIVQSVLLGSTGFSLGTSGSGGLLTPVMVTLGSASISGPASIINGSVTSSSSSFDGSTITSSSNVVFNNAGNTQISNGSGSLVVSSQSGSIQGDTQQNYSSFNSNNLFGLYFNNQSKTVIQLESNQTYLTANSLNGVTGQTIWFSNYFNPSSGTTIGSPSNPVILIVNNNAQISSGVTIYGFLYVIQGLSMNGGSVIGAAATENALNINGGNASITFNTAVLSALHNVNANFGKASYLTSPVSLQEIIP
jgi:Tfp pilus assembly protein PilX